MIGTRLGPDFFCLEVSRFTFEAPLARVLRRGVC